MSTAEPLDGLARRLPAVLGRPVEVTGLAQASGGASRETWFVELDGGARRLVLRRDPVGAARPEGMAREAVVLEAARAAGVPVPLLVDHSTDASILGSPYVLTEHVDGESIPRRLLREPEFDAARGKLARELGRAAALIHRVPAPDLPSADPLDQLVATYEELGEPLPAVEIAFRWLRANRPTGTGRTLVHGDFRNGNLIVGPDGLRAVLDWELVHLGDPMEDLGWLCVSAWRFGSPLPVGGFGTREELFDGYAEVAGRRPDPDAVRWWEIFGTARWGVICRSQAQRHLSGERPSMELAAIGRRVCEQEHDLLAELGVPRPAGPGQERRAPVSDLHGRPSAAELVAAVADFLRDEVVPGSTGRMRFQSRVAANTLSIVERELALGERQEQRHRRRLAGLGLADRAALAGAIRDGELDPWQPETAAAVWEQVLDRLAVANPRHPRGIS
ncbi:phosphotransferase family protein [Saccharopolyspora shandongensis]|uniref:phosphotransferase family protein n=1 Tax=Saccharopolyspora shandongensis TaxID=418495 RepID=UPI0034489ACD